MGSGRRWVALGSLMALMARASPPQVQHGHYHLTTVRLGNFDTNGTFQSSVYTVACFEADFDQHLYVDGHMSFHNLSEAMDRRDSKMGGSLDGTSRLVCDGKVFESMPAPSSTTRSGPPLHLMTVPDRHFIADAFRCACWTARSLSPHTYHAMLVLRYKAKNVAIENAGLALMDNCTFDFTPTLQSPRVTNSAGEEVHGNVRLYPKSRPCKHEWRNTTQHLSNMAEGFTSRHPFQKRFKEALHNRFRHDIGEPRRNSKSLARRKLREQTDLLKTHFTDIGQALDETSCTELAAEDMANVQTALVHDIGQHLNEEETVPAIIKMIAMPIMMNLMSGSSDSSNDKAGPSVGASIIDVCCLILTIPITMGLANALAVPMSTILSNILGEILVFSLTGKLNQVIKVKAGYIITQNMITMLVAYLKSEMGPVVAFTMATFIAGVLPTALTDSVTTALTNILLPKFTNDLAAPVMNYYYCIYCYYYGDYCQYCFYNNDMTWMDRDWWLSPQQDNAMD